MALQFWQKINPRENANAGTDPGYMPASPSQVHPISEGVRYLFIVLRLYHRYLPLGKNNLIGLAGKCRQEGCGAYGKVIFFASSSYFIRTCFVSASVALRLFFVCSRYLAGFLRPEPKNTRTNTEESSNMIRIRYECLMLKPAGIFLLLTIPALSPIFA